MGRTAPLTSKRCILYIYSTNIGTEYFKYALYSPFFSLQNAVCFIMLTCLVPVLFTFYIQSVLKLKKKNSGAKELILSDLVKYTYFPATQNWETARLVCHYEIFSQTARLQKDISKWTFFCFNAASGTLHEYLRTFHCCWRALVCNTQYFHIADRDM